MSERYVIRPDPEGFSVYDQWMGETVVIASAKQEARRREDAAANPPR